MGVEASRPDSLELVVWDEPERGSVGLLFPIKVFARWTSSDAETGWRVLYNRYRVNCFLECSYRRDGNPLTAASPSLLPHPESGDL